MIGTLLTILALPWIPGAAAGLPEPSRVGQWDVNAIQRAAPIKVFTPADDAPGNSRRGRPAIIYLKNLVTPRIGQEPDEAILADFLTGGFVVLTVDLGKSPKAVAPMINHDLWLMRRLIDRLFQGEKVDRDHVYILPEGYRLARNILYYGGSGGDFHLDIRYPAKPARPVPVLMQIPVDNGSRMSNKYSHWAFHETVAEGGLTRGYASAQVDNPIKRYRGVDHMPQVAHRLKAAVRTIRCKAEQFGFDGKHVAVMGFSRSSGQAGILAMSGGVDALEGDGPNRKFSSRVQCALLHAGRMDHEALVRQGHRLGEKYLSHWGSPSQNRATWDAHSAIKYVTPDDPPTFLSVGGDDSYRVEQIRLMAEALKKANVQYRHVVTPGMGHCVVRDAKVLGEIYDFFDKHLKGPIAKPQH